MAIRRRILFLDDVEDRHWAFSQWVYGHTVHHAYTVEDAIHILEHVKFDAAALDHTLGESSDWVVPRWIAAQQTPKRVLVHSTPGSSELLGILGSGGIRVVRASFHPDHCQPWLRGWA